MIKRGLVVEDDMILAMINRKYLEKLGCTVVASVTSAQAAIEAVKKHSPDFVLMDIRLDGEVDGITCMEEIRKFSAVPVIYVSGNSEGLVRERAQASGMLAFLVKPLDMESLREVLAKLD
jgi:CheY-like chemotaxis protein